MSNNEKLFCWIHDRSDEMFSQVTKTPKDFLNKWKLALGEALSSDEYQGLEFELDLNAGLKVTDSIVNNIRLFIVSEKLKLILQEEDVSAEFYKIRLINQKYKPVKEQYYLYNPLKILDCLDMENSVFSSSNTNKKYLKHVHEVKIHRDRVPEDINIFRLSNFPEAVFVKEHIARKVRKESKCDGLRFIPIEFYDSEKFW